MDFQKVLGQIERPFTFAVVGDTHFTQPEFLPDPDLSAAALRPLDADQYIQNVDYVLAPMMDALKAEDPAFIVMTGDLVEGQGDLGRAEMQAGLDFFTSYGIPLLLARGNHDRPEAFAEVVLPYLSRGLGWDVEEAHYFTDVAGCRLVLLDTTTWKSGGEQHRWLEGLLNQSRSIDIERTFLFGHHPIWPVARAFFTDFDFYREMPGLLERYPVDAFFCGHTHNQSIIFHRTGGEPVLQFMGAPIGLPEEIPTPLGRVQALLPPADDLLACWEGYLENTAPGWFLVRVGKGSVRVEWHHLNRGAETTVRWHRRSDVTDFGRTIYPPDARLIYSDLNHIRRASLRFCAWDAMQPGKRVLLNGEEVGVLSPGSTFAPRRMELPGWALGRLRMENRLEILAPEDEASTVGNLVLEAVLPGGRLVRTRPTGEVFTWSDRWDTWGLRTLRKVEPSRSIVTLLSFR